jgi:hypothetical protein
VQDQAPPAGPAWSRITTVGLRASLLAGLALGSIPGPGTHPTFTPLSTTVQ